MAWKVPLQQAAAMRWPVTDSARWVISAAARRLKVSSKSRSGGVPVSTRWASRAARVVVFPVPAPATMRRWPPSWVAATSCSSVSANTRSTLARRPVPAAPARLGVRLDAGGVEEVVPGLVAALQGVVEERQRGGGGRRRPGSVAEVLGVVAPGDRHEELRRLRGRVLLLRGGEGVLVVSRAVDHQQRGALEA